MKVRIMVTDECGYDFCEETYDSRAIEAMGDHFDKFIEFRIEEIRSRYPECRWVWREEEKTLAEERCDRYEEAYKEALEWALSHEDELDGEDPYEWASEYARDEVANDWW